MIDDTDLPVAEQSLVYRLRKRAEIRRQIGSRKSVQEGAADRIADLLEEAAAEIDLLRGQNKWLLHELKDAADRLTALGETTLSVRDCIKNIEEQVK